MEHVNGIHLLAHTYKLDGLGDNGTNTDGCTTTGVAVELGQHHTIKIETVVELFGGVDRILTCHGVNHEKCLVGVDRILQTLYLVHHLLVDGQTAGGIDDHHIIGVGLGLTDGILGNGNHIPALRLRIDGHIDLCSHHLELLDSGRTINVARHEQRILMFLVLEHVGQLSTESGLTRTLQS